MIPDFSLSPKTRPSDSHLHLGCWNPMQLTQAYRAESLSAQFAFLHILGLVGTQRRGTRDTLGAAFQITI